MECYIKAVKQFIHHADIVQLILKDVFLMNLVYPSKDDINELCLSKTFLLKSNLKSP